MEKLKLKIITPEKIVFENDEIDQVSIPTNTGQITILPSHIPLISMIEAGELVYSSKGKVEHFAVSGGFIEVKTDNRVMILADNAEKADEIDTERALAAREKALKQIEALKNLEDIDFAKLQAVIERENNRLKMGKKYRKLPKSE